MSLALVRRVVARYLASTEKSYRYDRSMVERLVRNLNDPKDREDSKKELGGYFEHEFSLVPLSSIDIPPVWNEGRIESVLQGINGKKDLPPVRLTKSKGKLEVEDGIHRTNASKVKGFTHVPAITSVWVETPDELVQEPPEKPVLPIGAWVKLQAPMDGRSYGWVSEHLNHRDYRGVTRHTYNIALVRPGDDWPDFVDLMDTAFTPTRPPSWGPKVKALVDGGR